MQIYFGLDNTKPTALGDLAALLSTRDQRLVQDAIQICCPAQSNEPGIYRILSGDSERLSAYIKAHSRRFNPTQRDLLDNALRGKTQTR